MLILAAVEVGLAVAQYALTPHGQKQQPVDRGRQDDLRFTLAAEGTILPYAFGRRVRMAGVLIDYGRTKEIKTSSPGSSGGKKGQGGSPPTTNFSYTKTFAIAFTANEMKSFRQIKEDDQIILDLIPENATSNFYEGEDSSNTFSGHTQVNAFANASNGNEITLQAIATNGAVQFNSVLSNVAGTRTLVIYYRNDVDTSIELTVNGGTPATYTLANSGNTFYSTREIDITCIEGLNTIKIKNLHTTHNVGIDRIYLFAGLPSTDDFNPRKTGVIADISYPSDQNDPSAFYDLAPYPSTSGVVTGNLATNGQVPFELFLGKADQPQSDILLALPDRNSDNTPAYEELSLFIAQNYVVTEGRQTLGNITAELEPKLQYLGEILTFLYLLDDYTADQIDFSAGANVLIEGFIYDRRDALTPFVAALGEAYGFDIVPIDGKCVLVMRGGASVITIPEDEMYGREEGQEIPHGPIKTEHNPQIDVPNSVDVIALDPSSNKEFHTADYRVTRQIGNSQDPDTLNLPLVLERDAAVAIGKRYLYELKLRSKPKSFATGPRYRHLTPADVITAVTQQATEKIVLTSIQAAFTGLVKFQGVPAKGALYSQTGPANPQDSEKPPVPHPSNTFTILSDVPALRDVDQNQFVTYVAMCGRGTGRWRGAHVFKEHVPGTDEWDRKISLAHPATCGVLVSNLTGVADPAAVDTTHSVVIDLFFDEGLFESRLLTDIQSRFVNVIVIGSGIDAEIIQFTDATYSSGTFPYTKRVTLNGHLLRGCRGTIEGALAGATAGTPVFLLTDAIGSFIESVDELNTPRNFKGVTVGQAIDNAVTIAYSCAGYSARGPLPTNFEGIFDPSSGGLLEQWEGAKALNGSAREAYDLQMTDSSFTTVKRAVVVSRNDLPTSLAWLNATAPSNVTTTLIDPGGFDDVYTGASPASSKYAFTTGKRGDGGDLLFEFQIPASGLIPREIMIYPETIGGGNSSGIYSLGWYRQAFSASPLTGYAIKVDTQHNTVAGVSVYTAVAGDRLGVLLREDGRVEYYLNYLGRSSVPVYVSAKIAVDDDYIILVSNYGDSYSVVGSTPVGVRNANWVRPIPEFHYNAEAQKADNSGSLPGNIYARVRQLSFVIGGQPSAWVKGTFTRP